MAACLGECARVDKIYTLKGKPLVILHLGAVSEQLTWVDNTDEEKTVKLRREIDLIELDFKTAEINTSHDIGKIHLNDLSIRWIAFGFFEYRVRRGSVMIIIKNKSTFGAALINY